MDKDRSSFVPFPEYISLEEYRERRDQTTAEQLSLLQQSPEFRDHYLRRKKAQALWRAFFWVTVLAAAAAFFAHERTRFSKWLSCRDAWLLSAEDTASKVYQRAAALPLLPVGSKAPSAKAGARFDWSTEAKKLKKELENKREELLGLRTENDATVKHSKLLKATEASLTQQVKELQADLQELGKNYLQLDKEKARLQGLEKEREALKFAEGNLRKQNKEQQLALQELSKQVLQLDQEKSQLDDLKPSQPSADSQENVSVSMPNAWIALLCFLGAAAMFPVFKALRRSPKVAQPSVTDSSKKEAHQLEGKIVALEKLVEDAEARASETARLAADFESQLKSKAEELDVRLEEWQEKCSQARDEGLMVASERDAIAAEKERLEAELEQIKLTVEQLIQASRNDAAPPGLGVDPNTLHSGTSSPRLLQDSNGFQGAASPGQSSMLEEDKRTPAALVPTGLNGRDSWHGLSDRVSDMRSQIAKIKRRESRTPGSAHTTPRSIQDPSRVTELEVEVAFLSKQNTSLEAQLDQVTASLADFVNTKAAADSKSLLQTQDLDEMAMLLARKEDDNSHLEKELSTVKDIAARLLNWLESKQQPPDDHLLELHHVLYSHAPAPSGGQSEEE